MEKVVLILRLSNYTRSSVPHKIRPLYTTLPHNELSVINLTRLVPFCYSSNRHFLSVVSNNTAVYLSDGQELSY
jgi:hypothetical protein